MSSNVQYNNAPIPVDTTVSTPVQGHVCLICIDGWGVSPDKATAARYEIDGDAIRHAETPRMDALCRSSQNASLAAHGLSVGLPAGLMGNSEVGHLNIGAGRVVYQDIVRIDLAVTTPGALGALSTISNIFSSAVSRPKARLHLLGLVSDGGVHSHQEHLYALLRAARDAGVRETFVHFFADGRDTSPKSAATYLESLLKVMKTENYGKLGTICGRYYAMDRDNRAERTAIALNMLLHSAGDLTTDPLATVRQRYDAGETDEFLRPIIADASARLSDDDCLFFFNYRSDRMRQIVSAFMPVNFERLPQAPTVGSTATTTAHNPAAALPQNLMIASMTQYKSDFPIPVAFPAQQMTNGLSEVISKHNIPQCHVAETEKYAHVTFFFNGGKELQFKGEDRVLIPSPKVATYDLKPEMSAHEVGKVVAETIGTKKYPFVMCNFAPPDMVGHTGKFEPAKRGVAATDAAIGVIADACAKENYTLFVTADHGNAEKMFAEDGQPHTAHTCARVPLCIQPPPSGLKVTEKSALCDVAPTILKIMGIPIPAEMDGKALF